jgi:hypothetical protein
MNPSSIFPVGTVAFHLRFDFGVELGLLDETRAPISAEAFEALRASESSLANVDLQTHNRERANFAVAGLPQFFLIFGAIAPGKLKVSKWISDGQFPFSTNDSGLWNHFLGQLAHAQGYPIQDRPCVYPPPLAAPTDRWTLPPQAVVHDTVHSLAGVLPWPIAFKYLAFNTRARTDNP